MGKIANIKVSANGTAPDTAHLHKYRFEPLEMKTGNSYFVDFDNDGDLDIVGNGLSFIRNDGNEVFTTIENSKFSINSTTYFADYDNDGDLDFLHKGDSMILFRNDGSSIFTDIKAFQKQLKYDETEYTSTPWCDYDNDGDLDLLLSGLNQNSEPEIYLYKNAGKDYFVDVDNTFKAVTKGTTEWIDYNNDGHYDLMLSGTDFNGSLASNLYKNNGTGDFSLLNVKFPNLFNGKFSWGDYDSDGDPDLIISGSSVETKQFLKKPLIRSSEMMVRIISLIFQPI
ncbi:MAG: VCBS repeat-containing protein [Bacteroidetes bacterium]|nr:VCBS repeat-containing protein [Bacteroidota bacterium]